MFNIGKFLARKGLTHSALAAKLNCSQGLVAMWASNKARPSYEKCVELLQNGMTVSELFGEEVARNAVVFPLTEDEIKITAENFELKVGNAVVNLLNKGFFRIKPET
jgi:transcriptional regulator with XRE-family HTH domain